MPLHAAPRFRQLACLALLLGVAGCAGLNDPFQREGTWQAENLNDANLMVMVANPHHLQQGVNDNASPGILSSAAVNRLLTDHVKPLPSLELGPFSPTSQATGSPGSASASAP